MNLTEEKLKLEKAIDDMTNTIASLQLTLSVSKNKLKKINRIIQQAEEAIK